LSACQPQTAPLHPVAPETAPDWLVIETSQEGVYRIPVADIRKAGLEVETINPETLALWRRGEPVPFIVEEQGQALFFYAPPPASEYAAADYYWLLLSKEQERIRASLRLEKPAAGNDPSGWGPDISQMNSPSDRILRRILLEENRLYTPQVEDGDRWLWEAFSAPTAHAFEIDLPLADGAGGQLRMRAWARTEGPGEIDHHWQIWMNDQLLVDDSWDGKGIHQFSASIPAGILRAGKNQLEIRALNDAGLKADLVYLDRLALEYTAFAKPEADRLVFYALGDMLTLQGFTGSAVSFQYTPATGETTPLGVFENGDVLPLAAGQGYWLAGSEALVPPHAVYPAWIELDLQSPDLAADYLAIGPQNLLPPLEPLLQFHTSQGLSARAVPVEAIYNQFNGGYPEPEGIRRFLRYTGTAGDTPVQYLLLVGDSTYDLHGYLASPFPDQLPSFFVDTIFGGQTSSDVLFSLLDPDDLPDLAVGRIPARTPEQVRRFVEKTLAYANGISEAADRSILAIADGQDPSFKADAGRFLAQFPAEMETQLLAPPPGASEASRQVIDAMRERPWLVAYFGHGSIDMWGRDQLLTTEEVDQLNDPDSMPILVNMTCLTGLFNHPEIQSLTEAMLFQEPGGAVAVLAPTSLTLPGDQSFLSLALAAALSSPDPMVIGDVLLQARRSIPLASPGAKDVLLTFLLFGDPALKVR
jgi:hypothetical protein